jgi:hypothetical protein
MVSQSLRRDNNNVRQNREYSPLVISSVGMSDVQAKVFESLMREADARDLDIKSAMRVEGLSEVDPSIATLRKQAEDELHDGQRALLGDAGFQHLQQYERMIPVSSFLGSLVATMSYAGVPLVEADANRLTPIIANATWTYQAGGQAFPTAVEIDSASREGRVAREAINVDAVLTASRDILSPKQMTLLEASLMRGVGATRVFNLIQQTSPEPVIGFVFGRR